jgi:hypothetical protein
MLTLDVHMMYLAERQERDLGPLAPWLLGFGLATIGPTLQPRRQLGEEAVPVGNRGRRPRLSRPLRVLESGVREGKLGDGGDQRRGWRWRRGADSARARSSSGLQRPGVAKPTRITVYHPRVKATSRY